LDVWGREDVDAAFAAAKKQADALFLLDCGLFNALGPSVMSQSGLPAQSRVPAMHPHGLIAESAG
jgi:hypothetical protein